MVKIIEQQRNGIVVEYEESDPIYSEGWTIGSATRSPQFTGAGKPQATEESQEKDDAPTQPENNQT